ncbi:Eukaryotic translation initiation factor 5A-2 [Halotydeus destructor]|nr:Eukaryotic translation initiation factor 5A-2 [Halotydeus destructor]
MLLQIAFTLFVAFNFAKANPVSGISKVKAQDLVKDGHIMLQDQPCIIVDIESSSTNEHNLIKFIGQDIFTNLMYEEHFQATDLVEVPEVTREQYPVIAIVIGKLNVEEKDGRVKVIEMPDGKLGNDIGVHLQFGYSPVVTVVSAVGTEKVVDFSSKAPEGFDADSVTMSDE